MAPVTLEVVSIMTLGYLLIWSICVSRAFTTRMASEGSLPDMADLRAAVRLSTWTYVDIASCIDHVSGSICIV